MLTGLPSLVFENDVSNPLSGARALRHCVLAADQPHHHALRDRLKAIFGEELELERKSHRTTPHDLACFSTLLKIATSNPWEISDRQRAESSGVTYGTGLSRFNDPTGKAFGLLYLGSSAKLAFVETILRDRADGRSGDCVIEESEIEKRSIATISPTVPLMLVHHTGDGPIKMGVPSDVAGARDQSMAQHWSGRAVARHREGSSAEGEDEAAIERAQAQP